MGNLLFNVQSEAFEKQGLQVPLTLLPHTRSEVEWRLCSRSARGCAMELGLFLLLWHCRLAPSSICSFGTYSCNDYEQSLIKLQRILPRNQCVSVYGDVHLDCSFLCLFVDECFHVYFFLVVKTCTCCWCVWACVWLIVAYHNSELDSLVVRGLTVSTASSLSCRWHQIVQLTDHISLLCTYYVTEC